MSVEEYSVDNPPGTHDLDAQIADPTAPGAILYYYEAEGSKEVRIKFANGVIKTIASETIEM